MSAGPIAQERAAHKPEKLSTPDAHRRCAAGADPGRGYCGRKAKEATEHWALVVCSDCWAARRADEAARP